MTDSDIAYFERRLGEERRRAANSADPTIALVHRRLADHYEHALAGAARPSFIGSIAYA